MKATLKEYVLDSKEIPFIRVLGSYAWSQWVPVGLARALINLGSQFITYVYNWKISNSITDNYVRKKLTAEQNLLFRLLQLFGSGCYPFFMLCMGILDIRKVALSTGPFSILFLAYALAHARVFTAKFWDIRIYQAESFLTDYGFRIASWASLLYDTTTLLSKGKVYLSPQFGLNPYYLILSSIPTTVGWVHTILKKQTEFRIDYSKWLGLVVPLWSLVLYSYADNSRSLLRELLMYVTRISFALEFFQRSHSFSLNPEHTNTVIQAYQRLTGYGSVSSDTAKLILNGFVLSGIAMGVLGGFSTVFGRLNMFLSYIGYIVNHFVYCYRLFLTNDLIQILSPDTLIGHAIVLYSTWSLIQ